MTVSDRTEVERPFVRVGREGGIITLTLARGEIYNPLSTGMIAALQT